MAYYVYYLVSPSFDKVTGEPKWRKYVYSDGPYKRLKYAKAKRAKARKKRAIFDCGDGFKDYGPTYTRVWIEEDAE